jgi:hypothetical protein
VSDAGGGSDGGDLYVVEPDRDTARIVRTRPYAPAGQLRDWLGLAPAAAAWALSSFAGLTVLGTLLRLVLIIPTVGMAWRCFDIETYRGRRRMRRELVFGNGMDEGGYREAPGLRPVRMDDDELPPVGAWELVVVKWARWDKDTLSWHSELALVMGNHVRVIASELVPCLWSDAPRSLAPDEDHWAAAIAVASETDCVAQFVEQLPSGLRSHVRIDVPPKTIEAGRVGAGGQSLSARYGMREDAWLSYGEFLESLPLACFFLLFAMASFAVGLSPPRWGTMVYLAIGAFSVPLLQRFAYLAGIRSRAPAALSAVYGSHVTPLPGGIPCRPGLALLLAFAVMIASGLGLVGLYQNRVRGHEHRAAGAPSSTPAPDDRPH